MKYLNLLLITLFTLFFITIASCTKEPKIDCIDSILEANDMIPYETGQAIGCKFFLELYHFRGKQYFVTGNHCISGVILYYEGCNGERVCEGENDFECWRFNDSATRMGIVGIEES